MDLQSELAAAPGGDGVRFTYRLENVGDTPVDLRFRTGQRVDVTVLSAAKDRRIWRASDGRVYTMALGSLRLGEGDVVTFEEWWRDPRPGRYRVRGVLAADSVDVPATTRFEVE